MLLNSIVSRYVIAWFQDVLLVRFLPRAVMVDDVRYAVAVSVVWNDSNVIIKNNDVAALPLLYLGDVGRKTSSIVLKINL